MKTTKDVWARVVGLLNLEERSGVAESYPLPVLHAGKLYVGVFQFPCYSKPGKGAHVLAPDGLGFADAATLEPATLDASTRLARVTHLPAVGWMTPSYPPQQRAARVDELFGLYDTVLPWFAGTRPTPASGTARVTLLERLGELHPGMQPYYDGAAPEFFGWLRAGAPRLTQGQR